MKNILFISLFAISLTLSILAMNNAKNHFDLIDVLKINYAEAESGTGKVKDVTSESVLVITQVSGDASLEFSVGDILDTGVSISGNVTAVLKDAYTVACYENGNCACTEVTTRKLCPSKGCPENCN